MEVNLITVKQTSRQMLQGVQSPFTINMLKGSLMIAAAFFITFRLEGVLL
jgi:hypothetical protein